MGEIIAVELSETAARIIHEIADRTGRDPRSVLSELVDRSVKELPVDTLSDDEVLALCDLNMSEPEQAELSDLLADQREGVLNSTQKDRLDELMQIYRHGL